MELFKVTLEYRDVAAEKRYDAALAMISPDNDTPQRPSHRTHVTYAAVHGDFGGDPIKVAVDLAIKAVVGPADSWEQFQPTIKAVEFVGSVAVES